MEPLLPRADDGNSSGLALALIRGAERLRASLHPITRKLVADLVRSMNSYYSNRAYPFVTLGLWGTADRPPKPPVVTRWSVTTG